MRRLKRHPESRNRPLRLVLSIGILAVLVGMLVLCLLLFTGICSIEEIEISGNSLLSEDEVLAACGVEVGGNLFTLSTSGIKERLEKSPWIKEAQVDKDYFNTVSIKVTERMPLAMINRDGRGYLVDSEGYVITEAPLEEYPDVVHIHGGDLERPPEVERLVVDDGLSYCVEALNSMPEDIRTRMAIANPFDERGQVFVMRSGTTVMYGCSGEHEKKNEILFAVLTDIEDNGRVVEYVDVRVPDSPVIKPI